MNKISVYELYTPKTARIMEAGDLRDADDHASSFLWSLIGFLIICKCRRIYNFFRHVVLWFASLCLYMFYTTKAKVEDAVLFMSYHKSLVRVGVFGWSLFIGETIGVIYYLQTV